MKLSVAFTSSPSGEPAGVNVPERVVLGGWPGFSLPDLNDVVAGAAAVQVEETVIDVRHHDTYDLRLAGDGIAVTAAEDGWTVDLPGNDSIQRRGASASAEIGSLLVAHLRGASLVEVARVRTRRREVEVHDGTGHAVGRVLDDEVSVLDHDHVAARFRELVIEGEVARVAESIERALRSAGATDPDPVPRLRRTLGGALDGAAGLGEWSSAAELVREQMVGLRRRWLRHDVLLRNGQITPSRYAGPIARLRALVRAIRPLVDRAWAESLDELIAPLAKIAQAAARTNRRALFIEVSVSRLDPRDIDYGAHFVDRARFGASQALDRLRDELDGRGYVELIDAVVAATNGPPFLADAYAAGVVLLPRLAAELFGSWRRSARTLDPADHDRIVRTIARVDRVAAVAAAAGLAIPAAEGHALRLRAASRVLVDAEVITEATAWLRDGVERGASRGQAFVAGVLATTLESDRVDLTDAWPEVWRRAERRKARAWLTS